MSFGMIEKLHDKIKLLESRIELQDQYIKALEKTIIEDKNQE